MDTSPGEFREAYINGKMAREIGFDRSDNPYNASTQVLSMGEWDCGWSQKDFELKGTEINVSE